MTEPEHDDITPTVVAQIPAKTIGARAAGMLGSLNPATLLFGPVFQKEMRTLGRKRGTYIVRALYALLLFGILGVYFWSESSKLPGKIDAIALQDIAMPASIIVAWTQFVCLCLMSPMLTSQTIVSEKSGRTIPALASTPLTSGQIIFNKLSSRFVQLLVLAMLPVPVLLAMRVMGGLSTQYILGSTAIALGAAALGLSLGVFYSIRGKDGRRAASRATFTLFFIMFGPLLVRGLISIWGPPMGRFDFWLGSSSGTTLAVLTAYHVGDIPPMISPEQLQWMWIGNTLYMFSLAILFAVLSAVSFRRLMMLEAAGGAMMLVKSRWRVSRRAKSTVQVVQDSGSRDQEEIQDGPLSEVSRLASKITPISTVSRTLWDAPVVWRELHRATKGPGTLKFLGRSFSARMLLVLSWCPVALLGLLYIGGFLQVVLDAMMADGFPSVAKMLWIGVGVIGLPVVVFGLFIFSSRYRDQRCVVSVGAIGVWLFVFAGMILLWIYVNPADIAVIYPITLAVGFIVTIVGSATTSVGSIAAERESQTWEMLLSTPLSAIEIIAGKMIGTLTGQVHMLVIVMTVVGLGVAQGLFHPIVLLLVPIGLIGPIVFLTCTGMMFGTYFKRSVPASLANLFFGFTVWAGPWILLLVVTLLTSFSGSSDDYVESIATGLAFISPFGYPFIGLYESAAEGVFDGIAGRVVPFGFRQYYQEPSYFMAGVDMSRVVFTFTATMVMLVHVGIGFAAAFIAVRRLRTITLRP